jgi:Tol biopolymer transport system component
MKFRLHSVVLSFSILLCTHTIPGFAFLNNAVRVDQFDWQHAQTEHFDIYTDKKDEKHLPRIAKYLEGAWETTGNRLDFKVPGRTPFFFYSNHNKFEQSTIVRIDEGTGGVTEAFKNRFMVFNDGSDTWLKHVIYHEFAHIVQFNVLYAGFWKSVRLLKSPFYALWFMEGMAEYGSGDIDASSGDMVVRDAVYTKTLIELPELQGFGHVKPNQVTLGYKTGDAAMRFLADEFGPDKVGKLLVVMTNHFDISSALEETLGTNLKRFNQRFKEWLENKYADFYARAKEPSFYGTRLTHPDGIPQFNETPVVSPDGKTVYYFGDRHGPTRLYALDVASKKSRIIMDAKWMTFEHLHPQGRGLSLSSDGRWLAFSGEKKQRDFLYLLDLQKRKLKKIRIPFDEIRSPVFSPVDNSIVVSGMQDGFTDLYLISTEGQLIRRLTDNPQDERDPVFTRDGKSVVYSGEVFSVPDNEPVGRDLYQLDLQTLAIQRLVELPGEERDPEILPDGSLIFVRDQNNQGEYGFNFYRWRPGQKGAEQITDMIGGAFSPRYNEAAQSLTYVAFYGGEKHIYSISNFSVSTAAKPAPMRNGEIDSVVKDQKAKQMTQALHAWSDGLTTPLLKGQVKPYRFQASTDLFLPFFFYSSLDGFVLADLWQFSDLLGNHSFQQQMQLSSGSDYYDFAMFYTYARFRPQLTVGVRSQQYYRDFDQTKQRKEVNGVSYLAYPLDRINSVNLGFGATRRVDTYLDEVEPENKFQDRYWFTAFVHDTVTGRYLVPTQGRRMSLSYQEGRSKIGGNQSYKSGGVDAAQYIPLGRESTLASRLFYARSVGAEAQVFRLGGVDRVRTVSGSEENKKHNVVITSAELRYRLAYLNARTKFLFPDFFFKAAYLTLFDDLGYGWNTSEERDAFKLERAENAMGVGIFWPTFIIQSYKIDFGVQWAKRTTDGAEVWYISIGPSF